MNGHEDAEVIIVDHDARWPESFVVIRDFVWPSICDVALRVDHVGSTSVVGLAGKPIIDIDIVVKAQDRIEVVNERLVAIGYEWRGNLGVEGREAFLPPKERPLADHHLYLVVENNKAHLDHLLLRNLLRNDSIARGEYETLKRENALAAQGDRMVYTAMKAEFVAQLLTRARAERGLPPSTYWVPTPQELGEEVL